MLPSLDDQAIRVALAIYLRQALVSDEGFHAALLSAQAAYPDKTIMELKTLGDEALIALDLLRRK